MYNIGICDDNNEICLQIERVLKENCKLQSECVKIHIFSSGEEVIQFLDAEKNIELIFLDIELDKINGVELGLKIREEFRNEETQIVYISAIEGYAMELFQVRPLHFLVKPLNSSDICSVTKKALEMNNKNEFFKFKVGGRLHKRKVKDILYFEGQGRQIKMVTKDEIVVFYGKLRNISDQTKNFKFISIHRSIIVNYNYIIDFSYDYIKMSNNDVLTISQSKRKEVRNLQIQYENEEL